VGLRGDQASNRRETAVGRHSQQEQSAVGTACTQAQPGWRTGDIELMLKTKPADVCGPAPHSPTQLAHTARGRPAGACRQPQCAGQGWGGGQPGGQVGLTLSRLAGCCGTQHAMPTPCCCRPGAHLTGLAPCKRRNTWRKCVANSGAWGPPSSWSTTAGWDRHICRSAAVRRYRRPAGQGRAARQGKFRCR
jgi:hypothetical protein